MNLKLILFSLILIPSVNTNAQVGIGTTTPVSSAQLDITSTTKGFLPPRMTHAQKIAILSPATGLQIWCTNCGSFGETQVYNGTTWTNAIGELASFATPELTTTAASSISAATATSGANVTSDGGSAITARGVCWGTTTNPTTALGTLTSDAGTTGTFTSNINGLSASTTYFVRAYATNNAGTSYGNEISFTTTAFVCGSTVTFTYKGASVTYGTVLKTYTTTATPPVTTTKCWMDRNLGATAIPTSKVDVNGFGDLFQWGRGDDLHQSRTSSTTTSLSSSVVPNHGDFIITSGNWLSAQNDNLWQGTNGVNNPCPSGFRLPTGPEMSTEWSSWGSLNSTGAFGGTGTGSGLRLTLAGQRGSDGLVVNYGTIANQNLSEAQGYYWTSSMNTGNNQTFVLVSFFSTTASISGKARGLGYSVRCIKN